MNKLKTDNLGGVSFDWDDWRWEQDGVKEAFFGLVSAWGIDPADSFIISGCESTLNGLNYDISAGFVALNGEIYKVDAHSVAVSLGAGNTHFWQEVVSFDPAGLEPTKNAGTVNTYEIRRAVVVNGTIPVPTFMPMVAETIHKKIHDKISPFTTFETIDLASNTNIIQNDAVEGSGNDINLISLPTVGSFIKYSIVGKVATINFNIIGLKTTTNLASVASSLVYKNLPFTFKTGVNQYGTFKCFSDNQSSNHSDGVIKLTGASNRIVFDNYSPQNTHTEFNSFYQNDVAPSKNWIVFVPLTQNIEVVWNLSGNFIAELN